MRFKPLGAAVNNSHKNSSPRPFNRHLNMFRLLGSGVRWLMGCKIVGSDVIGYEKALTPRAFFGYGLGGNPPAGGGVGGNPPVGNLGFKAA